MLETKLFIGEGNNNRLFITFFFWRRLIDKDLESFQFRNSFLDWETVDCYWRENPPYYDSPGRGSNREPPDC